MRAPVGNLRLQGTAAAVLFAFLVFPPKPLHAQTAPESEQFEVASIRIANGGSDRPSMEFTPGGGIRATNVTLKLLIQMAYDIRPEQLSGGPGWTDSESYTVSAKGADASPVRSQDSQAELTRKRLQALLKDRFRLELKLEETPAAGYVLTVGKNLKMIRADDAPTRKLRQVGRWEAQADGVGMPLLTRFLSVHMRGTVTDQTGLEGLYNFHLNWNPGVHDGEPLSSADERAGEALLAAVQEQLGLKLERQKVATDRYVIVHAEKPAAN